MKSLKSVSVFFLVLMPVVWGSISVADERSKGPAAADDSQVTSIILLQSAPPAIAETELADLVEKALRLKLPVVSDKAKPEAGAEFIQKTEAGFQIGTKQVRVMITTANTPYVSADDIQTVDDLRCRKMLQDHRAWISVEAFSEAAFTDALKLAAELVNKDTLGIMLPSQEVLLPKTAKLQTLMRGKDPVTALRAAAGMTVLNSSDDDPRMKAAIAEARKTWPEFVKAFEDKPKNSESFAVRFPFKSGDQQESMWVEVTSVSKDTVRGKLANEPVWSKDLRIGDEVTGKVAELTDWLYLTDGQIVGGYTVRVLTMQQEDSEK